MSFILPTKLNELKIQDQLLGVKKVSDEIKNIIYSATDDVIRIIERILVNVQSEGWVAKQADFYIAEGGQRYILENNTLSALGIEVRQRRLEASLNKAVEDGIETPVGNYSLNQCMLL